MEPLPGLHLVLQPKGPILDGEPSIHHFSRLTNEARFAYNRDYVDWGDLQPDVPTINLIGPVLLQVPGISSVYLMRTAATLRTLDNLVWTRGRHVVTVGAGILLRGINGFDGYEAKGTVDFFSFAHLFNGIPDLLNVAVDRSHISVPALPSYDSQYTNRQFFIFAQDSFRLTSRLTLNYGLRYENLGAPQSPSGDRDPILQLGQGADLLTRLKNSTLNLAGSSSGYLYQPDNLDFAPRVGFSYSLFRSGNTLLRGSYGIFYDRPFDNLWLTARTNKLDFVEILFGGAAIDFTQPAAQILSSLPPSAHTVPTTLPT